MTLDENSDKAAAIARSGVAEEVESAGESARDAAAHPSTSLTARRRGYGIGGGLERPYKGGREAELTSGWYGPLPHSGYFGAGDSVLPFKAGEAGFTSELPLFRAQYGETTSGVDKSK